MGAFPETGLQLPVEVPQTQRPKGEYAAMDDDALVTLNSFKELVAQYRAGRNRATRSELLRTMQPVREIIAAVGCYETFTVSPPPIVGGLLMRNVDAFGSMFDPPYGMDMLTQVEDMIDAAIGQVERGALSAARSRSVETLVQETPQAGYAFVAMSMNPEDKSLDDTLDAIKEIANDLGIHAERVDEQQENTPITDRILESIRRAEFVIVDLTDARPNVYYEAGYAQGLGKLPVYVAKSGSAVQFDLKNYPVIFWANYRELKAKLAERLKAVAAKRATQEKAPGEGR